MKKLLQFGLFALVMGSNLNLYCPEEIPGARSIDETETGQKQEQQRAKIAQHDLFFHEREIQNLDELRDTHQKEDKKGLSWRTQAKTWWDRKTFFGLGKKGPRAIVEEAFAKKLDFFEKGGNKFTLSDEQQASFKQLNKQEQLEFINDFQEKLKKNLNEKLDAIEQEVKNKTDIFNEKMAGDFFTHDVSDTRQFYHKGLRYEISELQAKLRTLETTKGVISESEKPKLEAKLNTKKSELTTLAKNYATFNSQQKSKEIQLEKQYTDMLNSLSKQINPLLSSDVYLRFNNTTEKFEMHKTNVDPSYKTRISEKDRAAVNVLAAEKRLEKQGLLTRLPESQPIKNLNEIIRKNEEIIREIEEAKQKPKLSDRDKDRADIRSSISQKYLKKQDLPTRLPESQPAVTGIVVENSNSSLQHPPLGYTDTGSNETRLTSDQIRRAEEEAAREEKETTERQAEARAKAKQADAERRTEEEAQAKQASEQQAAASSAAKQETEEPQAPANKSYTASSSSSMFGSVSNEPFARGTSPSSYHELQSPFEIMPNEPSSAAKQLSEQPSSAKEPTFDDVLEGFTTK